jgi:hypothetical protein
LFNGMLTALCAINVVASVIVVSTIHCVPTDITFRIFHDLWNLYGIEITLNCS